MTMFKIPDKIKVFGVGDSGINAVNKMVESKLPQIEFIAVDSNETSLLNSKAELRILAGKNIEEIHEILRKISEGANFIFIVAGIGDKITESETPAIAEFAKNVGALTIAVVTMPFNIEKLRYFTDGLIMIPTNDNIDDILFKTVQSISTLITQPGIVNLDFVDICTILQNSGEALIGIGEASGENAIIKAAKSAIDCPLLKNKIQGARGILFSFMSSENALKKHEAYYEATMIIQEAADADAEIMWGMSLDESFGDTVRVTIIATRFDYESKNFRAPIISSNHNKKFDNNLINIPPWMI